MQRLQKCQVQDQIKKKTLPYIWYENVRFIHMAEYKYPIIHVKPLTQ